MHTKALITTFFCSFFFLAACENEKTSGIISDNITNQSEAQQSALTAYQREYGRDNVKLIDVSTNSISVDALKQELAVNYINNYDLLSGSFYPDLVGIEKSSEWTSLKFDQYKDQKFLKNREIQLIYDDLLQFSLVDYIKNTELGGVDGRAFIADRQILIRSIGGGSHVLISLNNEQDFEEEEENDYDIDLYDGDEDDLDDEDGFDDLEEMQTIKILNYFTTEAAKKITALPNETLTNYIRRIENDVNRRFSAQGINLQIESVGSKKIQYTTVDYKTDLSRISDTDENGKVKIDTLGEVIRDGHLDEVHSERLRTNADIVALISTRDNLKPNRVGRARFIKANYDNAFFIARYDKAYSNLTYHHELGHMIGARHQDDANGTYERGHLVKSIKRRSIMAKNENRCCLRYPFWSDPTSEFESGQKKGLEDRRDNVRWNKTYGKRIANLFENRLMAAETSVDTSLGQTGAIADEE